MRLTGAALDLGRSSGEPLLDAEVEVGGLPPDADRDGATVWQLRAAVDTPGGTVEVDQWLRRRADGTLLLESSNGHALTVDTEARRMVVDGRDDAVRLQLVTTFGLPLLLAARDGVLVLHASACASADGAVVICGDSGRGKSSALIALVDAGWQAVSEDLCVLDLRSDPFHVWPGPPWVRRAHGAAGPAGAAIRFETPDKTAWDIAPGQVDHAVPVAELLFLEEPGGADVTQVAVDRGDAVRLLARHAVWFGDGLERGRRLFVPTVDVADRVPARRVRFPHSPTWVERLLELVPG